MTPSILDLQQHLIDKATKEHGPISTPHDKALEDCFTIEDGKLLFWFNTNDKTTKLLVHPL